MNDSPIMISWSNEDGSSLADSPDSPGSTGDGPKPTDSPREVLGVKELWRGAAREDGRRLPESARQVMDVSR